MKKEKIISIIGLGYVGLPLAVEFSKKYKTIGFDINPQRINDLNRLVDTTHEITSNTLKEVIVKKLSVLNEKKAGLFITHNPELLKKSNYIIITVPTPINKNNEPNLTPLKNASRTAGKILKKGDYVVYESTVYPGATEEECIPILELESNLKLNEDFFVGYSPERINPGDKTHTVSNIVKVTSGSNLKSALEIDSLYKSIIKAGTYLAPSIKIAEAAKVIENSQRDINIAFINELAKIFNKLGIDTNEVLKAAATKWNFLNFRPGLVGGHCIGVDPYYLAQKAQNTGYHPEILLSGRRMNDSMAKYIGGNVIKLMIQKNIQIKNSNILILGITFKENCPDIRNTKVIDLVYELESYGTNVDIFDPIADPIAVESEFKIDLVKKIFKTYDSIILAVAHQQFYSFPLKKHLTTAGVIYDVKGILDKNLITSRL